MSENPGGRGESVLEVGRGGEEHIPIYRRRKVSVRVRRIMRGPRIVGLTGRKIGRLVPGPEHGYSEEQEDGVFEP